MSTIKAVRGTRDLLPPETALWNRVETVARDVFRRYGFGEIRTPVLEATELFARGVGEETDIVSKEMYTWHDGDRFNKRETQKNWSYENRLSVREIDSVQFFKVDGFAPDLLVFSNRNNRYEVVQFNAKASIEAVLRLSKYLEVYFHEYSWIDGLEKGKEVGAVLIAAPEFSRLPTDFDLPKGVRVEAFPGAVFDSAQSLTLRPENTAGVVRAYIEHKLGDTGQLQKLYYLGPQFRRERPQKGRYRQFFQIGAEVIGPATAGSESPLRDAEVLEMLAALLDALEIPRASAENDWRGWKLLLNSVGSASDRPRYVAALKEALAPVKDRMCPDNQRRAETNPLRVLDSKDVEDQEIIDALPKIADYLDADSKAHFAAVLEALDACAVPYTVNPRLVRGLDYYTRTTFEFTVDLGLGTQNALLGGGRYDGLSEMLGGPRAPGIGFAIGEDRLILTLQALEEARAAAGAIAVPVRLDAYVAPLSPGQNAAALRLAKELRAAGLAVDVGDGSFRLKRSFEAAERVARAIVILGEDEVAQEVATVKTFATGEQRKVGFAELPAAL